jgi:hypothetical protein
LGQSVFDKPQVELGAWKPAAFPEPQRVFDRVVTMFGQELARR